MLRAYLDAVTLAEPLQGRVWAASQLTLTQMRTLRRIARGADSLGQLGAELGLAPPSVTRVVDRLEDHGLIERRRDAVDRRRVTVSILPAGLRLVTSVPFLEKSAIRAAVERMDPVARKRITRALADFVEAVRLADAVDATPAPVP